MLHTRHTRVGLGANWYWSFINRLQYCLSIKPELELHAKWPMWALAVSLINSQSVIVSTWRWCLRSKHNCPPVISCRFVYLLVQWQKQTFPPSNYLPAPSTCLNENVIHLWPSANFCATLHCLSNELFCALHLRIKLANSCLIKPGWLQDVHSFFFLIMGYYGVV